MVWPRKVAPLAVLLLVFVAADHYFNNGLVYQKVAQVSKVEEIYKYRTQASVLDRQWCAANRYNDNNIEKYEEDKIPTKFLENLPSPKRELKCGANGSLLPWRLDGDAWMIFVIKSARNQTNYRDAVRKTWAADRELGGKKFGFVFIVGLSQGDRGFLEKESSINGDILECDVEETYRNLPIKVIASLTWLSKQNHVTPTFVSVSDHDCVINRKNVLEAFEREESREDGNTVYCGHRYQVKAKPYRKKENKWFLSWQFYPEQFYPVYCHGALWVLSPNMISKIVCAYYYTMTEGFHLEDVLITGLLRQKVGGNIKGLDWNNTNHASAMSYHSGRDKDPIKTMMEKWKEWQ